MTEQVLEELIRKYAEGTASATELQQLMDWYHAAPVEDVYWPVSEMGEKEQVYHRMLHRLGTTIAMKPVKQVGFSWLKVAAVLLLFVGIAIVAAYFLKKPPDSFVTITNPSGKIQLVRLPDSSQVWLNASTTLRYARSFKENRAIELDGEAYFRVSHDSVHPFSVYAGGIRTTVLGTAFNVKAYNTAPVTIVSLISGSVSISDSAGSLALLSPAMQLQFDRKNRTAMKRSFDTSSVLAWKYGEFRFTDETFTEIAHTLENWYGVKIIFTNSAIQRCRFYTSFDNSISIEELLSMMTGIVDMNFRYDKKNNTITLSGKGCN